MTPATPHAPPLPPRLTPHRAQGHSNLCGCLRDRRIDPKQQRYPSMANLRTPGQNPPALAPARVDPDVSAPRPG